MMTKKFLQSFDRRSLQKMTFRCNYLYNGKVIKNIINIENFIVIRVHFIHEKKQVNHEELDPKNYTEEI